MQVRIGLYEVGVYFEHPRVNVRRRCRVEGQVAGVCAGRGGEMERVILEQQRGEGEGWELDGEERGERVFA